ncbi:MAG: hypothetical protein PHQ98_01110 [Candidatus ainarchaeum sp.]|nr:hypothetical protein [Candidatus ainarchaeum sp.]
MLSSMVFSISTNEAISEVTNRGYLLDNESATILNPITTISYDESNYYVVVGINNNQPTVYLPMNIETKEIATKDIEVSELIKTQIILSNMYAYSNLSYIYSKTKSEYFLNLARLFENSKLNITTVKTAVEKDYRITSIVSKLSSIEDQITLTSNKLTELSQVISDGLKVQEDFFKSPKTSSVSNYKKSFTNYSKKVDELKTEYNQLETDLLNLRNQISLDTNISNTDKTQYYTLIKLPTESSSLSTYFTNSIEYQTDIFSIFSKGENNENEVSNLEDRIQRNLAWELIYADNSTIKKIDSRFSTLNLIATSILSDDTKDTWKNQDAVSALQNNFDNAKKNLTNGQYVKSKTFAQNSITNVKSIIESGQEETSNTFDTTFIFQIAIGLAIILGILFIFEKIMKRKKIDEIEGENYENEKYY